MQDEWINTAGRDCPPQVSYPILRSTRWCRKMYQVSGIILRTLSLRAMENLSCICALKLFLVRPVLCPSRNRLYAAWTCVRKSRRNRNTQQGGIKIIARPSPKEDIPILSQNPYVLVVRAMEVALQQYVVWHTACKYEVRRHLRPRSWFVEFSYVIAQPQMSTICFLL